MENTYITEIKERAVRISFILSEDILNPNLKINSQLFETFMDLIKVWKEYDKRQAVYF